MTTPFSSTGLRAAFAFLALFFASQAFAQDTFAFVRQGTLSVNVWGPHSDLGKTIAFKDAPASDILFVHRAGTVYTVTDGAGVSRARTAWDRVAATQAALDASRKTLDAVTEGTKVPDDAAKKHHELAAEHTQATKDLDAALQQIATTAFAENHVDPM